ncbi:MAG TPA: dockerin type I domain-containing protein [Patescibacteria group bacterium]|nr:dockerin type I domain-containing protein [Patescibacteria group bacterium]
MKFSLETRKVISIAVIFFAIPLTVYFVAIGIKTRSQASANSVSLSFSQDPVILNPSTPAQVNLVLNAGTSPIGFANIEFTFDNTKVNLASEITTTPTLESPKFLNQGNTAILKTTMQEANQTGKVDIVLGLDPSDAANPPTGVINLANFSFISVGSGTSTLSFNNASIQVVDTSSNALTVNSTNSNVNTGTPVSSPTTSPTSTPTPTTAIKFKLQGVNQTGRQETPTITFMQGSTVIYTTNVTNFDSNSSGIYSGTVIFTTPGTYDIYVKVPGYLQKKFAGITLAPSIDLTGASLLAGDFNGDNKITIADLAQMLSQYTALTVPASGNNAIYDINNDGNITIVDVATALSNYTQLVVQGD